MKVGILALQGAFAEHFGALQRLDVEATQVYLPKHLDSLDALIIPGGESTAISRLMADFDLVRPIRGLATEGLPIMGTCAGLVLLATDVTDNSVPTLGVMDIKVKRNAFGRQVDSFETDLAVPVLGQEAFRAVFIRAPVIEEVGSGVEVLARLPDGVAVAAKQGKLVGCAFHPELTEDLRFHRYFLEIAAAR